MILIENNGEDGMTPDIGLGLSLAEMIFKYSKKSFKWNWGEYRVAVIEEFGEKYPGSQEILTKFLSKKEFFESFKKLAKGSEKDFLNLIEGLQGTFEKTQYSFDAKQLLNEIKKAIELGEVDVGYEKISTIYLQKLDASQEELHKKIDESKITLSKIYENTEKLLRGDGDKSSIKFLPESPEYNTYIEKLKTKLGEIPEPKTKFNLTFTDEDDKIHFVNNLYEMIKSKEKVILKGAAGSGKSESVFDLVRNLVKEKVLLVLIQISGDETKFFQQLEKTEEGEYESQMDILLKISKASITVEQLKGFEGDIVVVIDGINEFKGGDYGSLTEKIILGVGEYVRHFPKTHVLLTDRLDSHASTTGWSKIILNPLDKEEICKALDAAIGKGKYELTDTSLSLLSRPFFLNIAIERRSASMTSESSVLEEFFKGRLKLSDEEIVFLGMESFYGYDKGSVSFNLEKFIENVTQETFEKMMDGGAIYKTSDTHAKFSHQLLNDFLVSKYLVASPGDWNIGTFDIATLESSSTESIHLTMQQIKDKDLSNKFLLAVYDWNWRAAIESIILNAKLGIQNHSEDIVIAMLALVCQKQFDNVHGTSESAKKHMNDYEQSLGEQVTKASDLKELITTINGMESKSQLFGDWKQLFTIKRDSKINEETLNLIKSDNSLIGWTASNVLRECDLDGENQKHLQIIFDSSDADDPKQNTRRWRIVHTLGKCPTEENKKLLFTALEKDPYHWVRYGAARALVEMAAVTDDGSLRKDILDRIGAMAPELSKNIRDEIGRAVFYSNAFGSWDDSVIPLLEKIRDSNPGHVHNEYWEEQLSKYKKGEWRN